MNVNSLAELRRESLLPEEKLGIITNDFVARIMAVASGRSIRLWARELMEPTSIMRDLSGS